MKYHYAFDLDGTLADTKKAVIESYRLAGCTPPYNFWGKPWKSWLDDKAIHDRKNEIYKVIGPKMIKPLGLLQLQKLTIGTILTGASREAAKLIVECLNISKTIKIYTELSSFEKAKILNSISTNGNYFDDDPTACKIISQLTNWTITCVQQF